MRKINFLLLILISFFSYSLVSCGDEETNNDTNQGVENNDNNQNQGQGGEENNPNGSGSNTNDPEQDVNTPNTTPDGGGNDQDSDADNQIDLSVIKFDSKDVTYTGFPYSIKCENIPEGLTVEYEGNDVTNAGEHKVVAYIKNAEGETIHTLEAFINIILPQYTQQSCGLCEGDGIHAEPVITEDLPAHTPTTFKASTISVTTKEIATGVKVHTYTFKLNNNNTSKVIVTEIDLNFAGIAAGTYGNTTELTTKKGVPSEMATAYEEANPGKTVIAATNGDFFGSYPVNAFVKDGVIVKDSHNDNGGYDYKVLANDIPASKPMLFGVSGKAAQIKPIIQNGTIEETIKSKLGFALTITQNGKTTKLTDDYVTNHVNGNKSKINILTRTNKDLLIPTDTILLTMRKHGTNNDSIHGEIINIEEINSSTKRRASDEIYYITVPATMGVKNYSLGDIISSQLTSADGTWTCYDTIIGCRQSLVADGVIASTVSKENSNGAQATNIPRTALGVMPNGHVAIFSVEALRYGGKSSSSSDPYGLSLPQLADFMRYFGVKDGANLDGGGSTQLLIKETPESRFKVWVRSSDTGSTYIGQTRPVINGILVYIENEE